MTDYLKKFLNWKIVIGILVAVIAGELIWAGWKLTRPLPKEQAAPATVIPMAGLALDSEASEVSLGESFNVDINLSTGGRKTDGTDVILLYDPSILSVEPVSISGKLVPVKPGEAYADYPINSVEPGRIILSGIAGTDSFSGSALLGSVTFKTLKAGPTEVKIDYVSGSTADSNVTETGSARDILISVKNIKIEIKP